jgi:hypothetical protein
MLERPGAAARFPWFRADTLSRLLDLSDTLTFLAVPSISSKFVVRLPDGSSEVIENVDR